YTRAFGDGPRHFDHGQVTWTTPETGTHSPNYPTTPNGRTFQLSTDLTHRCPTRRVFSGTGLELVTKCHVPIPIPLGYRGRNILKDIKEAI
ncbi:hypothetical protein TNCV_4440301, partial [Trichonephila clavipes]